MSSRQFETWLITGGSTGLGRALADEAARRGARVAVTSRDPAVLRDVGGDLFPLAMDLTDPSTFGPALAAFEQAFGAIDVLVNNAGYGLLGAIEETSDDERRRQLEANFFGPAALTTAVLPSMRRRRTGTIVNLSSVSGVRGAAGSGYYAASKFALEGWSDSLRQELSPFGVHVMVIEPGAFRTDFFGRSRHHTQQRLGVYDAVERRRTSAGETFGRQPGDPQRGAIAMADAITAPEPPDRLIIGRSAVELIVGTLTGRLDEIEAWRGVSEGTDFSAEAVEARCAT